MATNKMANIENPFKFGSVVTGNNFIDRKDKIKFIRDVLNSSNNIVIIAPRRFGKTSLSLEATKGLKRPVININLQNVIDDTDFARQIVKSTLNCYPLQKIKFAFSHFKITPTISTDPLTGNVEVAFSPSVSGELVLNEAFALLESAASVSAKPIVIFDEFQDADKISPNMLQRLRAIMQLQNNINYILLGSQESMMREIFEKKKSPFYHFGILLHLPEIPADEFKDYLMKGFALVYEGDTSDICDEILKFTRCHPYYTQELAFYVWNALRDTSAVNANIVRDTINAAVNRKDYDYERLWMRINTSNKKLMRALASNEPQSLYTKDFLNETGFRATSTVRNCVKTMLRDGFIIINDSTKQPFIEDPFFRLWISKLL